MKVVIVLCLLVSLGNGGPLKGHKKYIASRRGTNRQDAVAGVGQKDSVIDSSSPPPVAIEPPPPVVLPAPSSEKVTPSQEPPAPIVIPAPNSQKEQPQAPTAIEQVGSPVLAPGTEIGSPVLPTTTTKKPDPESEEDDSSSEEEEAEDEARSGVPHFTKNDVVVKGYVTEEGQVLVPLNVYEKYFSDAQPLNPALRPRYPYGVISRQEKEEVSSEEEIIPVRVSPSSVIYQPKGKPINETTDNPAVEEKVNKSPDEPEESSNSVESEETSIPVIDVQVPMKKVIVPQVPNFVPLAAIPATRPTHEDDEEEAGRWVYVDDDVYSSYPQGPSYGHYFVNDEYDY